MLSVMHSRAFAGVGLRFGFLVLILAAIAAPAATPQRVEQDNLVFDGIPERDPQVAASLGQWLESRSASFVDWLADGSLLVSTRFADTEQLHRVRFPLGQREQLTWYRDAIRSAVANPVQPGQLVFLKD